MFGIFIGYRLYRGLSTKPTEECCHAYDTRRYYSRKEIALC